MKTLILKTLIAYLMLWGASTIAAQEMQANDAAMQKEVERGINLMADRRTVMSGLEVLSATPESLTILAVCRELKSNPAFREPGVRYTAYTILRDRNAGQYDFGFEALSEGTRDTSNMDLAILGLQRVPASRYKDATNVINEVISRPNISRTNLNHALLALKICGKASKLSLPQIFQILSADGLYLEAKNEVGTGWGVNYVAGSAWLAIDGAESFIDTLLAGKITDLESALSSLDQFGYKTRGTLNTDDATKIKLSQFIFKLLKEGTAEEKGIVLRQGYTFIVARWNYYNSTTFSQAYADTMQALVDGIAEQNDNMELKEIAIRQRGYMQRAVESRQQK